MNKYEAMFIVKPELTDDDKKTLFSQIGEVVSKNNGSVLSGAVWSEKRKLFFPLKRHREGIFYLLQFNAPGESIKDITHAYKLNENILRVLITKQE